MGNEFPMCCENNKGLCTRLSLGQRAAKRATGLRVRVGGKVGDKGPHVRVIYISGYAQILPEAQIPQRTTLLQKPFRLASLAEQLKLVPRKV